MGIHWFIFIAVIVIIIQIFVLSKFAHKGLHYERFFTVEACYCGDQIEMVERISNRKLIPVPWLRLESLIPAGLKFQSQFNLEIIEGYSYQYHISLFSLMPYSQITRRHKITCLKRGCYRLNSATITSGDLLGLRTTSEKIVLDTELLVYPKPAMIDENNLPFHSWQGDFSVRRWIVDDPFMVTGVREYRYGDALNGINWKATARNGRLLVHQRDFTADHRFMIYLNVEDHDSVWEKVKDAELIERGIAYAAGIVEHAIHQGLEVGFASNAHLVDTPKEPIRVAPKSGSYQLTYLLETMAKLVVERCIRFETLLKQESVFANSNMDIMIISAYVNDQMERMIEQLRYNGNHVVYIPLRQEHDAKQAGAEA